MDLRYCESFLLSLSAKSLDVNNLVFFYCFVMSKMSLILVNPSFIAILDPTSWGTDELKDHVIKSCRIDLY